MNYFSSLLFWKDLVRSPFCWIYFASFHTVHFWNCTHPHVLHKGPFMFSLCEYLACQDFSEFYKLSCPSQCLLTRLTTDTVLIESLGLYVYSNKLCNTNWKNLTVLYGFAIDILFTLTLVRFLSLAIYFIATCLFKIV